MLIFPAIDLRGGQVVRLSEGDYDRMTVYASDPAQIARNFKAAGAKCLHVVDLDGAKDGTQANLPAIEAIMKEGGLFVEVGEPPAEMLRAVAGQARDHGLDLGVITVDDIPGDRAVKRRGIDAVHGDQFVRADRRDCA